MRKLSTLTDGGFFMIFLNRVKICCTNTISLIMNNATSSGKKLSYLLNNICEKYKVLGQVLLNTNRTRLDI